MKKNGHDDRLNGRRSFARRFRAQGLDLLCVCGGGAACMLMLLMYCLDTRHSA